MFAEIVSIGTEILMGEIIDTNSGYLAHQLPGLGIELREVSIVGDDLNALSNVLDRAWRRSDVTITTGGLGPTPDDLTREAISQVLKEEMAVDDELLRQLKEVFRNRGLPMPSHNLKQAALIPSAQGLENAVGTAPGWWVEQDGHIIVAMPGPPGEMKLMWHNHAVARLQRLKQEASIVTRTIKTFGLPEAAISEMISPLFGSKNPYLGIYARPDGVFLRAIARASNDSEAQQLLRPMEEEIRSVLRDNIWGQDDETMEERIGQILRERGETLATMESFTGGLLASTITDVAGSSDYFRGGVVAYSNGAKIAHGVDGGLIEKHGAVSPEVAEAMAMAVCKVMGAQAGIGTTGAAGPSGLEGRPAGSVFIGVAYRGRSKAVGGRYPPDRSLVKRRGVTQAMLAMIRMLEEG